MSNPAARPRRRGFTLIEMMVVIVIIAVLAGLVVRILTKASESAAKAATLAKLERLKAAVEEYYAVYGQYPPVPLYKVSPDKDDMEQPVAYEYPMTMGMRPQVAGALASADCEWDDGPIFTFGLLGFLTPRFEPVEDLHNDPTYAGLLGTRQWETHNAVHADQLRDKIAVERWYPFIEPIITHHWRARTFHGQAYTNAIITVWDGWDRDFIYHSPPPHQSYLLYSKGPDGRHDPDHRQDRGRPANRDNIYGDIGH